MKPVKKQSKPADPVRVLADAMRQAENQLTDEAITALEKADGHPECDYRRAGLLKWAAVTACGCYDSNAQLKIGNIMEQGLGDIRRGSAYGHILEAFRQGGVSEIPMCGKCDDPFG